MTIHRRYIDGRWGQIHLRIAGSPGQNRPLLLLHPTPKSGWIWEPLMPLLAADRVVIAPDTPGYGASDAPPAPPSLEALADVMIGVVDALATDGVIAGRSIDVMGYHTGAAIAAAMADRGATRVGRLVLVSLPAYPAAERQDKLARLAAWPVPTADGSHLVSQWRLIERLTDPRATLAWKQASLTENLRSGDRATWGYRAVFGYDLAATLGRLQQPTLVLNPQDDLWEQTRAAAPRLADLRYLELPGVGHGLFDLDRERLAREVRGFLDGR